MVVKRRTKSRKPLEDERGRDALIRLLDRYVEALVAHDPARLPMSPRARFTENGQQLSLAEGLWGTATGASHRRYVEFADPVAGQVGFFGVVEEHGAPCIVAVRMKVVKNMITQLETLVVRNRGILFNSVAVGGRSTISSDALPVGRRMSKESISCANRYFDGIEQDNGRIIPVHPQCIRIENGARREHLSLYVNRTAMLRPGRSRARAFERTRTTTEWPFARASRTISRPVPPIEPKQEPSCSISIFIV
jgi:hypothetical protein